MASFILQVNTMRALVSKGVLRRDEAVELVDEARRQLDQLIAGNRSDRAAMLDRELLDYEAIFRDIDEHAAEDLLRTLRDALSRILDEDTAVEDLAEEILAEDIVVDEEDAFESETATGNDRSDRTS